jgi:hypothetical protein
MLGLHARVGQRVREVDATKPHDQHPISALQVHLGVVQAARCARNPSAAQSAGRLAGIEDVENAARAPEPDHLATARLNKINVIGFEVAEDQSNDARLRSMS